MMEVWTHSVKLRVSLFLKLWIAWEKAVSFLSKDPGERDSCFMPKQWGSIPFPKGPGLFWKGTAASGGCQSLNLQTQLW